MTRLAPSIERIRRSILWPHLENLRRDDPTWKVRPIEEDFRRLMWEYQDV
jgi:hypothetical protein